MRTLMKSALERMLDTKLDVRLEQANESAAEPVKSAAGKQHLVQNGNKNRRNGHSPKTIQGDKGKVPLDIPRDRQATFEPQLIAKHQRRLADAAIGFRLADCLSARDHRLCRRTNSLLKYKHDARASV